MTRRRSTTRTGSARKSQVGRPGASGAILADMPERELNEHVRVTVSKLSGVVGYHTYDSRHSVAGFPDWVILVGDKGWALELKTAKGRVSPAQQIWLEAFGRLPNWRALVVRPADWPAVRDEIVEAAMPGGRS